AARVAPGFAGADVVLPGVPRAADHLALARIAVFAGLGRRHEACQLALGERSALVRAAVRHGEELALQVEDDEFAAPHLDELAPARRDLACGRDDVLRHYLSFSP